MTGRQTAHTWIAAFILVNVQLQLDPYCFSLILVHSFFSARLHSQRQHQKNTPESICIMGSILTHQPAKGIWTVVSVLSLIIRLPCMAIYYLPSRLRPHSSWTYRQAFGRAFLKLWFQYAARVHFRTPKSLSPGDEKERFVVIQPPKASKDSLSLFHGVAKSSTVQPVTIGGTWFPSLYTIDSDSNKKVILHFHGGAYVLGGARQAECGFGANMLIKSTAAMVFCPQYRLACYPNGYFPAALQDAVMSYMYLLDLGISAERIIVSGDSAGGNLALALLRYLLDEDSVSYLPPPAAVLLWSPWLDLAANPRLVDQNKNSSSDYVMSSLAKWAVQSFVPSSMSASHPYISPAHNVFPTKVPIFLQVGGLEVLHDEITTFADKMKAVRGNRVEIHDVAFAPHDILLCGEILGWEKEAEEVAQAARAFLESQGI